jgi:protein-S-isoprenylcysteine O-methyltransferase Ste14
VRHPGYVGYILMTLATPISLGSLYAVLVAFIVCVIIVIRTALEDKTLNAELIGYKEYSKTVKYKLIPFIW